MPPIQPEKQPSQYDSPNPETTAALGYTEQQGAQAIENGYSVPQPQASTPPATLGSPNPFASVQQQSTQQSAQDNSVPAIADDNDLIEKEWVMKAKEIVERTKHDPYQQNKEVERFKADYMKKRYNKEVKLAED